MEDSGISKEQSDAAAENVGRWQVSKGSVTHIAEMQLDVIYDVEDRVQECSSTSSEYLEEWKDLNLEELSVDELYKIGLTFDRYFLSHRRSEIELHSIVVETHTMDYYNQLCSQVETCEDLLKNVKTVIAAFNVLERKHGVVTDKTLVLYNISENLISQHVLLLTEKQHFDKCLDHFVKFDSVYTAIEHLKKPNNFNSKDYINALDMICTSVNFLNYHTLFNESLLFRNKYVNLQAKTLAYFCEYFDELIAAAIQKVSDPENATCNESTNVLYYGPIHNAALKVKDVLVYIENKLEEHIQFKCAFDECQKTYITRRSAFCSVTVGGILTKYKERYKNDYSVLFRTTCLFVKNICKEEIRCYFYFFTKASHRLNKYLAVLCQCLYDCLRPSLININHFEILSELCCILKKEVLTEEICSDKLLVDFVQIIQQLLEDLKERLVYRTNVYLENEVANYKPSPGDLAYPEKLEQLENITMELHENRTESQSSAVSLESQEVADINAIPIASYRSYTGNSPADLHGMWYPTVKRTLVCLSRLYTCLDKETFQGLSQEALAMCLKTIESAADQISIKKSITDGKLFQIKHLLILREQIAPFQVDFTVKEVALDFSTIKTAAVELIEKRTNLLTFSSNNALLRFFFESTPRVKEYLTNSKKEIDRHLKTACDSFISNVTTVLIGYLMKWIENAESVLKTQKAPLDFKVHEFLEAQIVAGILSSAQRNIKARIPDIQRSMQLYLANRETEFILFRPIKNNIISTFSAVEEVLRTGGYTLEELLIIGCPSVEQINVLLCSVSLITEQDNFVRSGEASQGSVEQEAGDTEASTDVPAVPEL